ncbi:hypothetical protein BC941DRAFT_423621 [Chlamydoabsidia padenii]|nr:hypothetical protein BC941DRAFT_423621 [Chlamydoabsidia padenii]
MTKPGSKTTSIEEQDNLQQSKTTILLQQKQINSYEKLIKKQNDKIQSLRHFILKYHGKAGLEKAESRIPNTKKPTCVYSATTGASITNSTVRHVANASNQSRNHTKLNIRLGVDDMNSFFLTPAAHSRKSSSDSTQATDDDSTQTTSSSPLIRADSPPALTVSPTRNNRHDLDTHHKRRLSTDSMWIPLSSPPSNRTEPVHKDTTQRHSPHQRPILASVSQNKGPSSMQQIDDHFIKKPNTEFPYTEVVRKKDERSKLHGTTCVCCKNYFESNDNATTDERIQRYSRHRERYPQPSTPPGYWKLDFPDSPQK